MFTQQAPVENLKQSKHGKQSNIQLSPGGPSEKK